MKSSYHNMAKAIPVLLLAACIDNRNDFSGASTSAEEAANTTLPAPENLSANATGSEVNLTWDAVDGATAYNVYIYDQSGYIQSDYSPTNLGATSASASTRVSVTSHLVSSLEYEVDYYFDVTAVAGDLESGKSNEVGVRPLQSLSNSTPSVQLLDISANAAEVVTLSAEVSDPDGNGVSYLWRQTSGDSVDISDSDQAESYFTAPIADAPMELGFALTVSDDYGASNSKSATVSVSDNIAPQVDAGADQSVSAGALVDLLGSASDSDGGIAEVTWQLSSGSGVILSSTSTLDTSFVAPSSSSELTLVFQLSVTDDRGASASDTVTVTVGIDQEATIDSAISTSVPENTSGIVYTVSATSSEDEVLSYDFSGADIDDFTIDFDDGTIAFSNPPDYENPADSDGDNVYQLNFEVSDSVNTLKQALSIEVTDLDEFDVVAPGDDDAAANEIAENSDTGTLVGLTASASDADGTNNTISYSFAGSSLTSPDGLFDIDASTGVVSYNGSGSLDYETGATSYSLDIYAHSSDGSSASASFSVNIIDVNEAPVFASTSDSANALENSTDVFYSASATDEDAGASVSYFLASSGADNYLFNLDTTSGELQFKAAPDYETFLDSNSDGIYQVIISASDGSLSSENDLELAVSVSNVNEAPTITSATSASTPENTESTTTIYTASATDPENDTLTYALSGTDADDFNIDSSSGAISFANTPDHETPTDANNDNDYQIILEVSDDNGNSASQELTISVTDVNEIPLITSSANASVPENTTTTIYTASATDPEDDTLTYALSGTDTDDFIIDPSSGAISFVDTPNYEIPTDDNSNNVYQVTLEVSDDNDNNTSLVLTIKVTNVNEAPTFTSATSANVPENTTTTIYTASATDPENDTLTYALSGTDKDEFIIDSSSGAISFANTPDHETPTDANNDNDYQIILEVSDGNGNSASQELTITVTDGNEIPTITSATSASILENTSGTIYTASATDPEDDTLTYALSSTDKDDFTIDSSSGTISFTINPDYENPADADTDNVYQVTLEVSDGSNTVTQALTFTITDVNEHSVSAPTDADDATNQIAEDAAAGTAVGITASAGDGDGTNNTVSYSFDNDLLTSGFFSIDASSGVVTLTNSNSLDYETATSHDIAVKASSSDGSSATHTFTITVTDVDDFDVSFDTEPDADSSPNQIAENATAGTPVGITASASDADGTNNTVSYSFDNDLLTSGFFSIDASSGVVTLTNSNSLDYETATSHNIAVKASSSDGSSAIHTFTITVTDVDDFDVSFDTEPDADSSPNQIAEDAAAGTPVGITASAGDGDGTNNTVSYSFDNDLLTSGFFSIDASSGVVTLTNSNSLDYETATSHDIAVKASSSDGSSATHTFTITVTDVDDFDVSFDTEPDADSSPNQIAENATAGTPVGITASASDADGTNNTVSYSFDNDLLTSGFFSIDASSGVVTLTNSNSLDYETATSHNIAVKASSSDGSSAIHTFTITVTDVDDFDVSFDTEPDADSSPNQIAEDAAAGTPVGITASAGDGDGTNNTVSYSFDNDLLTSGFFSIDASSGVVTLTNSNSLDYETATSHDIAVKATSSDGSSATHTFTITVTDVDDFDVSFDTEPDADSSPNQIAENATAGTPVGITASASDADGTNNTVSYSFDNDLLTSGFFSIDASSGVVTLTNSNSLDYETATSHNIAVKASSSDGSSATHTFTVTVTDVDDFDVSFDTEPDADSSPNQIAENATAGTPVGITASASDADGTNNTVSYSFDNDLLTSGFFSIDASSGVVTLTNSNSLDYETATSHDIAVKASSSDGSSATHTFTVTVTDVDDFDVSFDTEPDADSSPNQIAEDAAAGTAVGIIASASDGDGTNNTVSYSFDNDLLTSGFFSIDASSGVVTLTNSNSLDYETATSHDIAVKATSSDGSSATHTFTVSVIDVDEFNVVFATEPDADSSPNQIAEDAAAGTPVGITASASDADGTYNTVSYSFTNDNQTSDDNLFSIDPNSGIVKLLYSNSLDYETATSHDIAVKAASSDGSTDSETFTIDVTDLNDNTPIITPSQSFDIDEASANDTSLGTVAFSDADSEAVNTFTWSITAGNINNAFAIDPSSGELTVNTSSELDYEGGTILYTLSLTVSDGATTSAAEAITINILDVSEHDAAPSAAYLGLPDNYINITFTPESGVSYQLHRSFVEGCTSSSCDSEGYQLFASPNSSGTADTMTFSQTHYYSLVGDNSTTFTTSINDSDGAKLAALVAAQSLSTEYDLTNDWVNISATDSNNVTYTLYMAGEPFAAGGCEDSELDNIGSLCADGSSLSDGSMHSATEVINWSARRYYRLDISDGYQVVHSLESNASVIDPVLLNASNASLTIDITWSALNSSKLAEYTVYLSDDSAATTASAATWSSLSNPQIISGNSSELYSLVPILSQYYVAITATNTENETTPLSKVYLVNNIVTGDPDPSTWHEIIADTDDSPAHWEGRSTHGSLVFQDKMWLIGGRTANEAHIAEVWSSTDGYNWTEVNPSAAFGARREFVSMVHDGKMWVLGGDAADVSGGLTNDVWYSSDGATWHEATPAASWHVRDYFGGVAFASGATGSDEMWVLGHYTGDARGIPGVEDHHYSTDGSTWSSVSVSGLPPSSFFPAITFNNAILIVGGYFYTNSAWSDSNTIYSSADGVNWAELSVSGSIWDARRLHTTLVYDDKLWVLAGYSGYNRDDYWYSPDGTQWHEVMASGSKWEARQVHTSVNYAGRMWMLGGYGSTGDKQLNDVWASGLEITSFSFNPVTTN